MVKIKVIKPYFDLERQVHPPVGEEFEVTEERAEVLTGRGFCEVIAEPAKKPGRKKATKKTGA